MQMFLNAKRLQRQESNKHKGDDRGEEQPFSDPLLCVQDR